MIDASSLPRIPTELGKKTPSENATQHQDAEELVLEEEAQGGANSDMVLRNGRYYVVKR